MSFDYSGGRSSPPQGAGFLLAKIGSYNSSGATLIIDGQTSATTKRYKHLKPYSPVAGDRVLVVKISGTYVILGAVVS